MKFFHKTAAVVALFSSVAIAAPVQAISLSSTNEDSIADSYIGSAGVGTHFHDDPVGFGTPADVVEVGDLGNEKIRGVAEFNLSSLIPLSSVSAANLKFDVFQQGGLFGQTPGAFNIDVFAFVGNGVENLSDFQISTSGLIGTFSTAGLSVGNTISFDATSIVNSFLTSGNQFLGVRLQASSAPNGTAFVFDNFRLDAQQGGTSVPEPASTLGLLAFGALGAGALLKRPQQDKA